LTAIGNDIAGAAEEVLLRSRTLLGRSR